MAGMVPSARLEAAEAQRRGLEREAAVAAAAAERADAGARRMEAGLRAAQVRTGRGGSEVESECL
jgi:hypothetical protein